MKRGQIFGGILPLAAAAMFILFLEGDASLPIAGALVVVGSTLIAVSRRKEM